MATSIITLERLPTEVLCEIFGYLEPNHVRTLRLVNKTIGGIADRIALKELFFYPAKQDFDMVTQIVNQPLLANHVTSLLYAAVMLSTKHQTLPMYTINVRRRERFNDQMDHIGVPRTRPRQPKMTEAQIHEEYQQYLRFFEEQQDMLDNRRDFDILEKLIAKLPNLREVAVSSLNELRVMPDGPHDVYKGSGEPDGGLPEVRNLRAILSAVKAAGIKLQAIRAAVVPVSFFDDSQFSLHSMLDLFQNLTHIEMDILAVEEQQQQHAPWADDMFDDIPDATIAKQLEECRTTMQKGVLRRALENMPNLVTLDIAFEEYIDRMAGVYNAPVTLGDIIPLDHVFKRLKTFKISNVESDRQEIIKFLARHKESLTHVSLGAIKLAKTSWLQLLPALKSTFKGTECELEVVDLISGYSEDGDKKYEAWNLGNPYYTTNPISKQLHLSTLEYLLPSSKAECPLNDENMVFLHDDDDGEGSDMDVPMDIIDMEMMEHLHYHEWFPPAEGEEGSDDDDDDYDEMIDAAFAGSQFY